jgi:hypothetical protein
MGDEGIGMEMKGISYEAGEVGCGAVKRRERASYTYSVKDNVHKQKR